MDGGGNSPASRAADPFGSEQKQVTILFADICGSTALISRMDSEDASRTLISVVQTFSAAVRRFGGVVNRELGDGIMALFGAPVATEDHAARACFAALAALDAVRDMGDRALPMRVGISSGPVILRKTGHDDEDYDVAGVAAHIAARLEQHAQPGTILIGPDTACLASGIARVEPLGEVLFKGLAEKLPVFRLVGATDRSSWIVRSGARALSTFVGREAELALLSRALTQAWEGRAQGVALVGDAGMGKSRLVHEVLANLTPGEWHVTRVETTARSTAIPYFLVTALLREFAGCSEGDSTAEIAARLPAAIAALGADFRADITPLLIHLDSEVDDVGFNNLEPGERRQRLVHSLRPILGRYANLDPLILVLEDYHWLDASSIELLDELFSGFDAVRLALLVTTRPERRPGWTRVAGLDDGAAGARIEIELKRLTGNQADALLRELIGGSDDLAKLRAQIIGRADGTPFFLEEFARSLHESGAIEGASPRLGNIVIPASVQSILAARIDRLAPANRRILQIAAVIGRDVPLSLLADVADTDERPLGEAMTALRAAKFLVEESLPTGIIHSFSHALTQAVAYDSLLRTDRRALHDRVLRALETQSAEHRDSTIDQLVHHAECAEAWPEVARYAVIAGERASRRSALIEAKAYLETAISALNRQPPTIATLTLGIDVRLSLRGVFAVLLDNSALQDSLQYLAEADRLAELAGDRFNLARVYISRGIMLSHRGDLQAAVELCRTALDVMLEAGDSLGIVSAGFALAQTLWYAGDIRKARDILVANIEHARSEAGKKRGTTTFVLPAAVFFCYLARVDADLGDHEAGFAALREARDIATSHGHAFDQVLVSQNEGVLLLASGQLAEAVVVLERALKVARSNKIDWHVASIASVLGRAYVDTRRYEESRRLLEESIAFADQNRYVAKRLLCSAPLILALAEGGDGDLAAARDVAERTLQDAAARGFRTVVVQTQIALARVLLHVGKPGDARAALQDAVTLSREIGLVRESMEAEAMLAAPTRRKRPATLRLRPAAGEPAR